MTGEACANLTVGEGGGGEQYVLDVISITIVPNSIQRGQSCNISGVIKNTGTAPSPVAGPYVTLTVNGTEVARTQTRLPLLQPGATIGVDVTGYTPTISGTLNVCWKLVW